MSEPAEEQKALSDALVSAVFMAMTTSNYDRLEALQFDAQAAVLAVLAQARAAAIREAAAVARALNDPFENQGYMYEIAADAILFKLLGEQNGGQCTHSNEET
jgi:hypothetical protein